MSSPEGQITDPLAGLPSWLEDLRRSFVASPQTLLFGNVRDVVLIHRPGDGEDQPDRHDRLSLHSAIQEVVLASGYQGLFIYDRIDGLRAHAADEEVLARLAELVDVPVDRGPVAMTPQGLAAVLLRIVQASELRTCIIVDFAARLTIQAESLTPEEHGLFATCEKLAHTAQPTRPSAAGVVARYNQIIWVTDHDRDLPSWFLAGTDRRLRHTSVPLPGFQERLIAAQGLAISFEDARAADDERRAELESRFAEATDGMTIQAMVEIQRLGRELDLPLAQIDDAARSYRVGVTENPWRKPYLRERLTNPSLVTKRVLGQDDAVRRALDIITRSVTGLNGAHTSGSASRPRGVLFFAGPTGVGKTELAKSLTELIFGDERAYIRFDMSEFSAEQAEARLIGAPPGYVGHDAGGELTNAMRERPFSVVLFDEIEKAHPRILDKFLQILEDGRLTDGAGSTTYFTESVIVFTSNLGTYTVDEHGERVLNASPGMERSMLVDRYQGAIKDHFTVQLNRPELLNRLGDNIVVFNYIDDEVGRRIFSLLLDNVVRRVDREHKAELALSTDARSKLETLATSDLSLGGRGIGSVIESSLVNPLARAIFANPPSPGDRVVVTDVRAEGSNWEVTIE